MRCIARLVLRRWFLPKLAPSSAAATENDAVLMVCALAMVESSLQPMAYRFEAHINEASTGLMQVG